MSKKSEGKHAAPAAPAQNMGTPADSDFMGGVNPAFDMGEAKKSRNKKGLKVLGITMGIIVAVLAVAYVAGFFVFTTRFFPNTYLAGTDISMNTKEEVAAMLDEKVVDYEFSVTGQGVSMSLTSKDLGMALDSSAVVDELMQDVNPWAWPVEVFGWHDEDGSLAATYSSDGLMEHVNAEVAKINETATQPVNATIAFDKTSGAFKVVPESYGTAVNPDAVAKEIVAGFMKLESSIKLTEDVLMKPTVFKDDPRFASALSEANAMIKADIQLMMDGHLVTEVTPELISGWVTVSPEVAVTFDDAAFGAWVDEVCAGCDTVGTTRTYTRPDGKAITVSGGSYGWEVDTDTLRTLIVDNVKAGTVGSLDVPVYSSGNGYAGLGERDWGNRYCDIDLAEQHAYFYDESGALVWESDLISGSPGKHATPEGVYYVTWGMASPSKLIGEKDPETGKPEYETMVQYWIPFIGNSIGLHDANWQYNGFGGSLYSQGYGSHGCVNLPVDKAAELYNIIQKGDVVVTHW